MSLKRTGAIEFYKKGSYDEAIKLLSQCIESEPSAPRPRRLLAEVLFAAGDRKKALLELAQARKIIPRNKNLKRRLLKVKYGKLAFWVPESRFKG